MTLDGLKGGQIVRLIKHTEVFLADYRAGNVVNVNAKMQTQLAFPT